MHNFMHVLLDEYILQMQKQIAGDKLFLAVDTEIPFFLECLLFLMNYLPFLVSMS